MDIQVIVSTAEEELIREEFFKTQDINKVARRFGVSAATVRTILEPPASYVPVERYGGWGRPELVDYIVSRKHNSAGEWPAEDRDAIREARYKYDIGLVEMCQGRDGEWFLLYAIPRKRSKARPPYFNRQVSV